jgi:hypothetical protein
MLAHIPEELPSDSLCNSTTQIRCFGHILELVAKAFVSVFMPAQKKKKSGDDNKASDEEGHGTEDDDEEEGTGDMSFNNEDIDGIVIHELEQLQDRDTMKGREIELLTNELCEVQALTKESLHMAVLIFMKVSLHSHSYYEI